MPVLAIHSWSFYLIRRHLSIIKYVKRRLFVRDKNDINISIVCRTISLVFIKSIYPNGLLRVIAKFSMVIVVLRNTFQTKMFFLR